ncbi:hypothetical protein [Paenibacillus sp. XY044]|uniref:hypothetical protein n=1 Tax=Paenibacillus sp. XY044 TaxID=2026089 RepID=UPI00359C912F
MLERSGGKVRLWTRHENEVTARYPELLDVPVNCGDMIPDGELAYLDRDRRDLLRDNDAAVSNKDTRED